MRLIAPQFVKPYVKSNKNDRNDAESDLRGDDAAQHAVRGGQNHYAAGHSSCAP